MVWIQLIGGTRVHLTDRYDMTKTACGITCRELKFSVVRTSDVPICRRCLASESYSVKQAAEEKEQLSL